MSDESEKMIEEAERLSECASPGPWRVGTLHAAEEVWAAYPEGMAGLASERLLLRLNPNFTSEQDTAFIARARTMVPELAAALRRAEAELDAATTQLAKKFKRLEELEKRAEQAEAERDAQHALVLRLTGELQALATKTGDVEWREDAAVKVVKMRGRQIAELTATRDLLLTENAQLQKERDAAIAMEADTARRSSAEIDSLKAELNEARGEVEDLNRRVEEVCGQRDEARERLSEAMRRT